MKYRVEVAGQSFEVEPLSAGRVRIDGQLLDIEVVDGVVLAPSRVSRFHLQRDERGIPQRVLLDGHDLPVTIQDAAAARRAGERRRGRSGGVFEGPVLAPMNGQVVKIRHSEGEHVDKGDVVLVLEAMKMENEVAAPASGRLASVRVAQGANVKPGDVLFVIEPDPS